MSTALKDEVQAAHWGIEPVPAEHRRLSGLDVAVLWGDLGIGLLVIVAGALLTAPPEVFGFGLSLPAAFTSIVLGSVLGCVLLGLGGFIGAREGRPTMVLLRRVLGEKGSWIPTALNVAQLIGWTAFELWAMGLIGDRLGERLFGFSSFGLWLVVFTVVVLLLSLWGPLGVVHKWMERFGLWVIATIGALVTIALIGTVDLGALWARGGAGGAFLFGTPMDIVIAMPVSWVPLVADYNRFASNARQSFFGTFGGYLLANVWFYMLGAVLVIGLPNVVPAPESIAVGILSLAGLAVTGWLLLVGLLVGETDEAFADVYSGAVSLRNILPKADSRMLVSLIAIVGALLAGSLTMIEYELFLFLIGSIFLPLLGVWFADYFILGVREERSGIRVASIIAWIAGFIVYHWIAPTPIAWWTDLMRSVFGNPLSLSLPWLGASIPSFVAAFAIQAALGYASRRAPQTAS